MLLRLRGNWGVILALLIWLLFVLACFFPESLWGVNHIATLPVGIQIVLLLLALIPIFIQQKFSLKFTRAPWLPYFLGTVVGLSLIPLKIFHDPYGDSIGFIFDYNNQKFDLDIVLKQILWPNPIHPRVGERTVNGLALFIGKTFGLTFQEVYQGLGVLFGGWFVGLWVRMSQYLFHENGSRLFWIITVVTLPALSLFAGHCEVYIVSIPLILWFLFRLIKLVELNSKANWFWMLLAFYLAAKTHISVGFFGVGILAVWVVQKYQWSLKKMAVSILLPLYTFGLIIYFFVFGDHKDERYLAVGADPLENLFLPLFSANPPYDRYTLLGPNHLADWGNLMLIWSPLLVAVFLGMLLVKTIKLDFNNPTVKVVIMTISAHVPLFFFMNPMLGYVMDWDLLIIPMVGISVLMMVLFKQQEKLFCDQNLGVKLLGVGLLGWLPFVVNLNESLLVQRLTWAGKSTYEGYYFNATRPIHVANKIDPEGSVKRMKELVEFAEPFANYGADEVFAIFCHEYAIALRNAKQFDLASVYHEKASLHQKNYHDNTMGWLEAEFMLQNYKSALLKAYELIKVKHPTPQKAYLMGIHIALKGGFEQDVVFLINKAFAEGIKDEILPLLKRDLDAGRNRNELLKYFE